MEQEVVRVHLVAQLAGDAGLWSGLSSLELTPLPLRSSPLWLVTSNRQLCSRERLRLFALTKELLLLLCPLARSVSMKRNFKMMSVLVHNTQTVCSLYDTVPVPSSSLFTIHCFDCFTVSYTVFTGRLFCPLSSGSDHWWNELLVLPAPARNLLMNLDICDCGRAVRPL